MRWPSLTKLALLFLVACAVSACSGSSQYEPFNTALAAVEPTLAQSETIVLIPGEGCGGCISDATSYIYDKVDMDGLSVVFTGVEDKKLLSMQLGEDFLTRTNVFLDDKNVFMHQELKSIYPRIISMKKGSISDVVDFDTGFFQP